MNITVNLRNIILSTVLHVSTKNYNYNLFYNKFYFMPLHVSSICAHHQEVKIAFHSFWYRHTETSDWSKITKIQFYKYEHTVVKFMYEFFGCDYCI